MGDESIAAWLWWCAFLELAARAVYAEERNAEEWIDVGGES
jgi:hypothetical protein